MTPAEAPLKRFGPRPESSPRAAAGHSAIVTPRLRHFRRTKPLDCGKLIRICSIAYHNASKGCASRIRSSIERREGRVPTIRGRLVKHGRPPPIRKQRPCAARRSPSRVERRQLRLRVRQSENICSLENADRSCKLEQRCQTRVDNGEKAKSERSDCRQDGSRRQASYRSAGGCSNSRTDPNGEPACRRPAASRT